MLHGDDALVNLWPSRVTFNAAYGPRLSYLERDKQRTRLHDQGLHQTSSATTCCRTSETPPSRTISTEDVDAFKDDPLERVAPRPEDPVIRHGVTARARREG
jgi:hypothetical protein